MAGKEPARNTRAYKTKGHVTKKLPKLNVRASSTKGNITRKLAHPEANKPAGMTRSQITKARADFKAGKIPSLPAGAEYKRGPNAAPKARKAKLTPEERSASATRAAERRRENQNAKYAGEFQHAREQSFHARQRDTTGSVRRTQFRPAASVPVPRVPVASAPKARKPVGSGAVYTSKTLTQPLKHKPRAGRELTAEEERAMNLTFRKVNRGKARPSELIPFIVAKRGSGAGFAQSLYGSNMREDELRSMAIDLGYQQRHLTAKSRGDVVTMITARVNQIVAEG